MEAQVNNHCIIFIIRSKKGKRSSSVGKSWKPTGPINNGAPTKHNGRIYHY